MKTQWCVVVGKPRMDNWKVSYSPDLTLIGKIVDRSTPNTFNTRKEARERAKKEAMDNPFWRFHATKFGPIHNC
jgi:hypothetical protein